MEVALAGLKHRVRVRESDMVELLFIAATDLFGGYTFNTALSRRMMDIGSITA
jgi:hypothetical protein